MTVWLREWGAWTDQKAVGLGNTPNEPSFGASNDAASVKGKLVNLISSVRTLMRSEFAAAMRPVIQISADLAACRSVSVLVWWSSVKARKPRRLLFIHGVPHGLNDGESMLMSACLI